MKGKRKVTKRIAAWFLCLAMVLTTINLPMFTTVVQASTYSPSGLSYGTYLVKGDIIKADGGKMFKYTLTGDGQPSTGITSSLTLSQCVKVNSCTQVTGQSYAYEIYLTVAHNYTEQGSKVSDATCTSAAIYNKKCPGCSATSGTMSVGSPLGHNCSVKEVVTEATCATPETYNLKCSRCSYVDGPFSGEELKEHYYISDCDTTCEYCDYVRNVVSGNHDFSDGVCVCGYLESCSQGNHDFVDQGDGNHKCSVCGSQGNHNFSENGTCACGLTQVEYEVIEGTKTVRITGPNADIEKTGDLVIPNTVKIDGEDYLVTEIGDRAFYNSGFSGSLTIPDNVKTIGNRAFAYSGFSGSLNLGSGIETISESAFYLNRFSGSLTIPDSVKTIGDGAFYLSRFSGSLDLGSGIETIGESAFCECGFTGSLTIPDSVKTIGGYAFCLNRFTGSLTIPDSVTTIGEYAFYSNGFTGSLTLGGSVETIGEYAFSTCGFTGSLTIPDSVTTIGAYAFDANEFTGSLTIPNSVTTIGEGVFRLCGNIDSISIPCTVDSSIVWGDVEEKVTQRNHDFAEDTEFEKIDENTHQWTCSTCGGTAQGNHDFSEQTCTPDEEGKHVQICKYCTATKISDCTAGETVEENRVEPGCATKGSYDQVTYCVDCEQELTRVTKEISVTGNHDFSKCVSNGNGTHKVVCADCGAVQSGHDKDACSGGTATCTAKAKCSECSAEYGSLKAHTNKTTTTKATTSKDGSKVTKCSACGKVASTTTIVMAKTFTLAKTSYEYTGSQIKPAVTVKDSKGNTIATTNYTVTYGTNKAVGKGTVKVTFKSTSNYSGSNELSFKIVPKKTTIGTPAIASDGITVKWTKNTTCDGYYIYRSVNGATYTKATTIKSNATVSWKDTTAKTNGNKYQYKIIAYKTVSGTTYTSAASAIKTTYFLTRPTVTLANQASAIKVSWGKNAKATGYYVYKSTDGGKTYKKVKTVTSNSTVSYTDTAAKTNGTKYMYKVEAYKTVSGTTYKSAASAVKTMYFVSRPAISSLTNSAAGKMLIKWARNAKATGYEIQYSTSSSFISPKSVTATGTTTTLSKTIGSLTKGKTYYVRIRSYKTVGTTKYYSAWSDKKSVKIVK